MAFWTCYGAGGWLAAFLCWFAGVVVACPSLGTPGRYLLSFPSGINTLSLPHSQVRFRISSAWSSSRLRLWSGLQCSLDQFLVQFGESGVGG